MLLAGRYRLDVEIGRGGMGEVWRAYDETLARAVAVKLLLPQDTDATAASRFRLEAQTAGRLNHPNVVGVLDFGEYDNRLYLVMELVEGDSLARVLSVSGALPAERVARLAAQAAAGLAAAHEQGIVHRDVKPANLLLDAGGTLKIGDFGIARFLDDPGAALTATGQIVGTGLYLAPERALGRPAGPASDMYSLGCVLYQLLSGRPPFQADTAVALLHQHLDNAPVPPRELGVAGLPPAFESYLLALLAKQPEDRPTAQQAAEWFAGGAWRGLPEPLPEAASPVPPAGPGPYAPADTGSPATYAPADTGSPATYALPTGSRTARGGRSRRAAPRNGLGNHRRTAAAVAAAAVFLAAMLAGMQWFSPDDTATEGTEPDASPSASSPAAPSPGDSTGSADPLASAPAAATTPTADAVADVTPSTTAPDSPAPAEATTATGPAQETGNSSPEKADKADKADKSKQEQPPQSGDSGEEGDEGDD
ncbi:serine/threonine-protein kinase [Streptomyces afghaniensis]|uniref:serine/threonine-protein kinase n=1 Tax=Streptomyces afghaniensis TaxID=66865 RepID=UPI002789445B|nr:serine/threonine-protein kinase [Streptomyces afghaniensis]MDQ1021747.1 serine/threonine protein kinase [Streptomyces afghaniensis]